MSAACCSRLAPIRLTPYSYFCTCWKVSPKASPSFSWLIPSIMRRMRSRLPTCLSMGFGTLVLGFAISNYRLNLTPGPPLLPASMNFGVDEAPGSKPDLVAVAFLLRQIVDGDGLCGAAPVEHRDRIDQVLLEQRVLDRARDTVV